MAVSKLNPVTSTNANLVGVPSGLTLRNTYTSSTSGLSFPVTQVYAVVVGGGGGGAGSQAGYPAAGGGGGAAIGGWIPAPTSVTIGAGGAAGGAQGSGLSGGSTICGPIIAAGGGRGGQTAGGNGTGGSAGGAPSGSRGGSSDSSSGGSIANIDAAHEQFTVRRRGRGDGRRALSDTHRKLVGRKAPPRASKRLLDAQMRKGRICEGARDRIAELKGAETKVRGRDIGRQRCCRSSGAVGAG
jgi:hypothetical protein